MILKEFRDLLKTVCANVSHYEAKGKDFPRIVYVETEKIFYYSDNRITQRKHNVDVHFFTKTEFDSIPDTLEDTLNDNGITFDLDKIEYGAITGSDKGNDEGILHYLYKCEV